MQNQSDFQSQKKTLKNPLVYTFLILVTVAAYTTWVFLSRHLENRAYQQRIEKQRAQRQREGDQAAIEQLGGNTLAVQMLYATPQIQRGESAQVCFGVANAKSVTLEPQSNPVWPSHNLCVEVRPSKTTTYTLTATGSDGRIVSQQVTVVVR